MSKLLRSLLIINAAVSFLIGAALLLAPGRALGIFSWITIDPLLTRLLGAALIALAWGSFFAWRKDERVLAKMIIQMEFIFNSLGALGFSRHLLTGAHYPSVIWFLFILLLAGTLVWGYFLVRRK